MMKKKTRIIREEFSNGDKQYRVQKKWFFNLFWTTDMFYDAERDMWFDAVFDTLSEAEAHIGIDQLYGKPKLVKRTIIR